MLNNYRLTKCFVILAALVTFCVHTPAFAQREVTAKIIEGTLRPVSDFPMVAQVYVGDFSCTGTLVASKYVLTAAHCFFDEDSQRITTTSEMTVLLNDSAYEVSKVSLHPSYVSRDQACVANEVDAAVIELKTAVAGITPVPLLRSAPTVGTQLLLVGFGTQGNGSTGEDDTSPPEGFVNIGYTSIERVSSSLYLDWDFDSGEANTATGDSGGPAFMEIDGVRYVNSITCGGTGNSEFGTESTNTRADAIASWVDSVLNNTTPTKTFSVSKAKVDFGDNNNYTFSLKGTLDLGKNFAPNKTLTISFAGYRLSVKLSRAGSYERRNGDDYVELLGKMSKGKFKDARVKFDIGLADQESLFNALSEFFPEEANSSTRVDLPVVIEIGGVQHSTTISMKPQRGGERWSK